MIDFKAFIFDRHVEGSRGNGSRVQAILIIVDPASGQSARESITLGFLPSSHLFNRFLSHWQAPEFVSERNAAARVGAAAISVAQRGTHPLDPDHRSMHRVRVGGEFRRGRSSGFVGNFPDGRALDGNVSRVQRRFHAVRRLRAASSSSTSKDAPPPTSMIGSASCTPVE
jgi:hypothetical protein